MEVQCSYMVTLQKTVPIPQYPIPSLRIMPQVLTVVHLTGRKVHMTETYTTPPSPTILQTVMVVQCSGQVTMVKFMTPTSPTTQLKV